MRYENDNANKHSENDKLAIHNFVFSPELNYKPKNSVDIQWYFENNIFSESVVHKAE